MSERTDIQWCDSTINPTMGCDGCELWTATEKKCYAGRQHVRRAGKTKGFSPTFEQVTFWPGRMAKAAHWRDQAGTVREDKPWLDGLPRLVFISDMSDSLSKAVTFEFLRDEVIANVTTPEGRRHHWLWLTKRPGRMASFSRWLRDRGEEWPDNLWAGTSITDQGTTGRIRHLLNVGDGNTTRFVSVEPQREPIDLSAWLPRLSWVIHGGESGNKPFRLEWAIDLIGQCKKAGVPYFLKQLGTVVYRCGERVRFRDHHAGDWSEWPAEIRVREMPIVPGRRVEALGGQPARRQTPAAEPEAPERIEVGLMAARTRPKADPARPKDPKRVAAAKKAWQTMRSPGWRPPGQRGKQDE